MEIERHLSRAASLRPTEQDRRKFIWSGLQCTNVALRRSIYVGARMHEHERASSWVPLSRCIEKFEPFMIVAVQGLGRLDASLATQDATFLALSESERLAVQSANPFALSERLTLSYLWVLGAYELVRAIDEKCRNDPSLVSEAQAAHIKQTKVEFERVRIPLAKISASAAVSWRRSNCVSNNRHAARYLLENRAADSSI
jgi:hypothetical protein